MTKQPFNSEDKQNIRKNWGKSLLKFLSEYTQLKLSYMGLPSPDAKDIEEWLEYIDEVIAFQCRKYGEPSHPNQKKYGVIKLENKLRAYQRQGKLTKFNVYDGYLEEVLLKGTDNSNNEFIQNNTIKVYNLDFCNRITSPLKYTDNQGNFKKAYKFDAINKVFEYQQKSQGIKSFVLFLTINSNYDGQELNNFLKQPNSQGYRKLTRCRNLERKYKKRHILRLFIINQLEENLRRYKFIPHFLPTITYLGSKSSKLLHFTLFAYANGESEVPWYQNLKSLCGCDKIFLKVDSRCNQYNNPVNLFTKSKTYAEVWQ